MTNHYSPDIFLFYAVGSAFYDFLMIYSFLAGIITTEVPTLAIALSAVGLTCRLAALTLQWLVWTTKANPEFPLREGGTPQLRPYQLHFQAFYPVLISFAVALRLLALLLHGPCTNQAYDPVHLMCNKYVGHGGMSLTLLVELIFNPLLTFALLRDTPIAAIRLSWAVNLAILLTYTILLHSPDVLVATLGYVYASVLFYQDSSRRLWKTNELLNRLQATLAENETLAVEAQAIELRAMIGNIAHDLKSPLTSFLSGVECMLEVVLSWENMLVADHRQKFLSKAPANLATIKACLHSMTGTNRFMTMTINRCLDYTKASKGFKLVPKQETVPLRSVLDLPLRMMRDVQTKIDIQVNPWNDTICSHIITDKQWLLENLLCLLSNAVKYSHTGHVDVGVFLIPNPIASPEPHDTDTTEQHLRFEVLDMGIGLSDEVMEKLFAPFKQAQRLAGGTGLGLFSLARRVEALHGEYGVRKRPDGAQGSLFWFTIPYRPDVMSASLSRGTSNGDGCSPSPIYSEGMSYKISPDLGTEAPDTPEQGSAPSSFTILVVDDAPLIVRMTTMLLKRKGHSVHHAVNGAEALEKILDAYKDVHDKPYDEAGTPAFDVVVMDLQMPIMDGIEAIRRVRAAEREAVQNEAQLCAAPAAMSKTGPSRGIAISAASMQEAKYCDDLEEGRSRWEPAVESVAGARAGGGPADHTLAPPKLPRPTVTVSVDTECAYRCSSTAPAVLATRELSDGSKESKDSTPCSKADSKALSEQSRASRNSLRQRYHQFIIAVSANSDHETVQAALSAGADSFISKPFAYESFLEAIEHRMK